MTNLGERVRVHRRRAGLSQTDLAGDDLSPSYVSLIEAGKRTPSLDVLQILAGRLGCSVADLDQDSSPTDTATARLELAYSRLALANGEPDSARERLALLLDKGPIPRELEHEATKLLADAHQRLNELDAAIRLLDPLYLECLAGRSHLPVPAVSYPLCHYYLLAGDVGAAVRVGERGVQASYDAGLGATEDHLKLESTLMLAYYEADDLTLAWAKAEQIMRRSEDVGSATGQGAAYWNAALVAEARGEAATALHLSERALALMSEEGTSRILAQLQYMVAWFTLVTDPTRADEAARILDRVADQLHDLGGEADRAEWESYRGLAHLLSGELSQAERLTRRAVLHLREAGDHRQLAQALITLGDALFSRGDGDDGVARYREAAVELGHCHPNRKVASLYREVAHRLTLAGEVAAATDCLLRALDIANVHCNTAAGEIAFGLRRPTSPAGREPSRDPALHPASTAATGA